MTPVGRTCAVVLNWNQAGLTRRCVTALLAAHAPGCDVLVVDNGSRTADFEALKAGLPSACRLHRNAHNLGFAGGMNVGIRDALRRGPWGKIPSGPKPTGKLETCPTTKPGRGYEFIWLLNNDAFPAPDCLPRLLEALQAEPGLGSVTPTLFGEDGREQGAVARIRWDPLQNDLFPGTRNSEPVGAGFWLNGAAMLFRAEALARAGGFDERFFAYWEEVDLFQRVAGLGYWFRAVPGACCVHLGSESSGGGVSPFSWYMMARNAWLFLRKHARLWRAPGTGLRLLAGQLGQAGLLAEKGHRPAARALLAGTAAGLAGRSGTPNGSWKKADWADALLVHPWGLGRLIRMAARAFPAEAEA